MFLPVVDSTFVLAWPIKALKLNGYILQAHLKAFSSGEVELINRLKSIHRTDGAKSHHEWAEMTQ